MTDDPITNSMLPKMGSLSESFRPNDPAEPPEIDVYNLDVYTEEALKQVIVDLRIKRARINYEIAELDKIIQKFQIERTHLFSRSSFYQDITVLIQTYFEEEAPCQTNNPDIPPSQN